jgi:hypothetical protein
MHRYHTDDSAMIKYHDDPNGTISKGAASLTFDAGFQDGGGATMSTSHFLGFMAYNRLWFDHDHFGFTFGGGAINNPGRYLVLLPPINGATAFSETPYFTENPGDPFWAWDMQLTGDYMPTRNITFRIEFNHRWTSVPYWSGPGGVTPPGGNTPGAPGSVPPAPNQNWTPDLRQTEDRLSLAFMLRY